MAKTLLVTIDVEADADIHWVKGYPYTFTSVTEGIPKFLRPIWDEYKIHPIYFVSPEVMYDDKCCHILKDEISKGAIIGAHLHPDFIEPEKTPNNVSLLEPFPCFGYDYEIEKQKIQNLRELIITKLGVIPIWYRAARFGADADTIKILQELGFKYDSSFTPDINWKSKGGPDHSKIRLGQYRLDPYEVIEHPITIAGKRFGLLGHFLPNNWLFYRWLRPTHMTYWEEKKLLRKMLKNNEDEIVMMFHSMEVMIGKTPYVRNKLMQKYFIWRLKKTLSYAIKVGYKSYENERNSK